MEYYSAIKKNKFEPVLMRWMKLEPIIQSEVSLKEKHLLIFKLAKWTYLPNIGPHNLGTQYMSTATYFPGRISALLNPLLFFVPSEGIDLNLITFLSFLPDSVGIFLSFLVVWDSFYQYPVSFQW